jgi:hypothetical protein
MKSLPSYLALGVALLLCFALTAEEKPGKKANRKQAAGPVAAIEKQLATLDLGPDQKEKVDKILADYKPKFAANKAAALTAEQKQAQKEAQEKAKADGKKGKEARAEVEAALKLTDEQKKARAANQELQASLKKDLAGVLNAEQLEKAGLQGKKKKKNA